MKTNLLKYFIIGFAMLPILANGQITLNNSTFPVPGDTLRTITTVDVASFDKSQTGADITWDFSNAGSGFLTQLIYADPADGESSDLFPEADLLDNSTLQEIYYQTFNNKVVEIGRSGLDPVLNLIDFTFENEGEAVLRRAPMSFGDVFASESSFFIASSADVLPDSLLDLLPFPVDSVRLLVETSIDDDVDAWGTVELPNGNTYDALRVKRTTTTNTVLGAKAGFFGWVTIDPDSELFSILGPLLDLLGENTVDSYQFFANDNKEILASFTEDLDGNLVSMTYKGDISTSIGTIDLKDENLLTYPNPTYGDVTFQLMNLPHDNYKVVIYNILGKKMWSSEIDFFQGKLRADLSQLRKGTYIYSILNGHNQKVITRRLMIMTP